MAGESDEAAFAAEMQERSEELLEEFRGYRNGLKAKQPDKAELEILRDWTITKLAFLYSAVEGAQTIITRQHEMIQDLYEGR